MSRERILLILVGGYVACTFMTIGTLGVSQSYRFSIGLAVGSCFAFALLAAAWTVFGPCQWKLRFILASVLLLAMPSAIFSRDSGKTLLPLLCEIAIFTLVVGVGVLIKLAFRVQLRKSGGLSVEIAQPSARQYGIRHLMILTASVAILLTIGRQVTPSIIAYSGHEYLVFAFLAIAVCIICLPIVFSVLALCRWLFPTISVLLLSGVATLGEYNLFQSLRLSGPKWIDFVWLNTLTFLPVLLASLGLRLCGYRLVRQLKVTAVVATHANTLHGSNQHGS